MGVFLASKANSHAPNFRTDNRPSLIFSPLASENRTGGNCTTTQLATLVTNPNTQDYHMD